MAGEQALDFDSPDLLLFPRRREGGRVTRIEWRGATHSDVRRGARAGTLCPPCPGAHGTARTLVLPASRCVGEFLSGNGRRIHEAAFRNRKHRHALLITAARCGGIFLSAARTGRSTGSSRTRGDPRGHRHGADAGAKFE